MILLRKKFKDKNGYIFKIFKVKYETSKGFALGLVSHGIGTARAIEISEKAAAFGALAMGLSGIFTAIFLPMIITFFKWLS